MNSINARIKLNIDAARRHIKTARNLANATMDAEQIEQYYRARATEMGIDPKHGELVRYLDALEGRIEFLEMLISERLTMTPNRSTMNEEQTK